jgi:curved DNA-binding protein CbpA
MIELDAYKVLQVDPEAHLLVIQAAYRVLAALYHPDRDQSGASTRRMAELNLAYAKLRTADRRALYDQERRQQHGAAPAVAVVTPYEPGSAGPRATSTGTTVLDFGRYNGWTIKRLASQDPDYLHWLRRHSSGIRYRAEIEATLREAVTPTMSERTRGRRD